MINPYFAIFLTVGAIVILAVGRFIIGVLSGVGEIQKDRGC